MADWRYVPQLSRILILTSACGYDCPEGGTAPLLGLQDSFKQAAPWVCAVLQVVGVYGSWHLGQLQVGLSRAKRLCQCSRARIITKETLPMQVCSLLHTLLMT